MRNCPHCLNTAVIEDGYCGMCRQTTMPPLNVKGTPAVAGAAICSAKTPELETINRLYLELSQFATATTNREMQLLEALTRANDVCRSMHAIVERRGVSTSWDDFKRVLDEELKAQHAIIWPNVRMSDEPNNS